MGLSCSAPICTHGSEVLGTQLEESSGSGAAPAEASAWRLGACLTPRCAPEACVCQRPTGGYEAQRHLSGDTACSLEEVTLEPRVEVVNEAVNEPGPEPGPDTGTAEPGLDTGTADSPTSNQFIPLVVPRQASLPELPSGSSRVACYGSPVSPEEAAAELPAGDGGLTWLATVVGDDWKDADNCGPDGEIRPRRPRLPVRASSFSTSLVQTKDGRWVFSGVLNGWPALRCLELLAVEPAPRGAARGRAARAAWAPGGPEAAPPPLPAGDAAVQVVLRMAPWTAKGWSKDSMGFVWWYFAQNAEGPAFAFGQDIVRSLRSHLGVANKPMPRAVQAHLFVHRYALGRKEDKREQITYHAAILLEWDHGQYCSVVELGPLNGIAARQGRSDWFRDKLEPATALSQLMPACIVMPWKDDRAEIRVSDVEAKNLAEFKAYVKLYTGPEFRFVDPQFQHSGQVWLSQCSQEDIMGYLLNYMNNDQRFAIQTRSCQTFAADFYSLLVGEQGIEPFHPTLRKTYVRHTEWFLYSLKPSKDEQVRPV